jgi:hypothetical protein|tara:strand:- start:309 stop:1301 length:993 start_codon:yes stop_codon:yes gene_type:complete
MYVGVAIQNGFAEAAGSGGTSVTYYEPDEVRGGIQEFTEIASNRRMNTRFRGAGYIGTQSVPFGMTVELNPMNAGTLLALVMGTESLTVLVTAQSATHKFYPAENLRYGTIWLYSAGAADNSATDNEHKIINFKVTRASIEGGIDDVVRLSIDGIGTDHSAVAATSPSFTNVRPFFLNSVEGLGTLSIGSAIGSVSQFDECRRMRMEIDNAVSPDQRIDNDASAASIREGDSSITGMFDCIYNGNTYAEIDAFTLGSDRAFTLSVNSTTAFYTSEVYNCTLGMEQARYNGANPSWDPDLLSIELPYIGELASSAAVYIQITNSDVVTYTY